MNRALLSKLSISTIGIYIDAMIRDVGPSPFPNSPVIYWKQKGKWYVKLPAFIGGANLKLQWRDEQLEALDRGTEMVAIWFPQIDRFGQKIFICCEDGTYRLGRDETQTPFTKPELEQNEAVLECYFKELELHWPNLEV